LRGIAVGCQLSVIADALLSISIKISLDTTGRSLPQLCSSIFLAWNMISDDSV
jgi:hypothetical protein